MIDLPMHFTAGNIHNALSVRAVHLRMIARELPHI